MSVTNCPVVVVVTIVSLSAVTVLIESTEANPDISRDAIIICCAWHDLEIGH